MFTLEEVAAESRADAAAGASIAQILEGILAALGADYSPFRFIAVLRTAFDVPVRNLKDILDWGRLSEVGTSSTAEAIELVRPWLVAAGAADGI